MKKLFLILLSAAVLIGGYHQPAPVITCGPAETPEVNLPDALRQKNWDGKDGSGSCVHATTVMLLRWNGNYRLADWWKATYSGGEIWGGLTTKLNAAKVPWVGTYGQYDIKFLEWSIRTRRGCMVTIMQGRHMVMLVDLTDKYAYILDNNAPDHITRWDRTEFLNEWYYANSWALTVVFSPAPPILKKG